MLRTTSTITYLQVLDNHHLILSTKMAVKNISVYAQCTQITRFSAQDGFRAIYLDVSQDGSRLVVSGFHSDSKQTFIDLFTLKPCPDSQKQSSLIATPLCSKDFAKIQGSSWRCACLLDDSVLVTCCGGTIESYDTEYGRLVNQGTYTGRVSCMTTRHGEVYVGLCDPGVIVFDHMLKQIQKITLSGIEKGWPWDIAVNNKNLFICTGLEGRALVYDFNGYIEQECEKPNKECEKALRITVSEKNGLVYILWWAGEGKRVVVVYSLPGGHSDISGGHILASFNVAEYSERIRVNNVNRLFVVTKNTGEVYEYHTEDMSHHQS